LSGGRRVVVDDHAICEECGGALEAVGPDQWRHAPRGRPKRPPRITLARLKAGASYEAFMARFPWATCAKDDWREAVRRLEAYHAGLAAACRRRELAASWQQERTLVSISSLASVTRGTAGG
jgi:hypothetical protein